MKQKHKTRFFREVLHILDDEGNTISMVWKHGTKLMCRGNREVVSEARQWLREVSNILLPQKHRGPDAPLKPHLRSLGARLRLEPAGPHEA
jgi:hypothetical protein